MNPPLNIKRLIALSERKKDWYQSSPGWYQDPPKTATGTDVTEVVSKSPKKAYL